MKNSSAILEEIKSDKELRPMFFDLVCRGFVLGLSDTFQVVDSERVRFQRDYYNCLLDLSEQLKSKVDSNDVLDVIQEVSKFYLSHVGRISFEDYNPERK